jgi:hypothetical protein
MKYGILGVLLFMLLTFGFSQKSIDISVYRVKMSNSDFEISRIKSFSLFSARKMYFQSQNDEYKLLEKTPNQIGCIVYISFKPLSIIGDQIQYLETSRNDPGKNCALRNVGSIQVASYDFQNKKSTKITDFFSESDIIKNLMSDKIIQKFLNNKKLHIETIDELIEKLSDHNEKNCETAFNKNIIYNFSFHHIESTKVAIRLWLSYMCGSVPSDTAYKKGNLQIGLLLNPNQYTKQLIAEQKFIFTKDFETQKANPTIDFYYSVK